MNRPNILLLFPDSHRGDWLPYDEQPIPLRMPCVKRLMDNGVTFSRAVTPAPLCAPARACLAAGVRYAGCGTASNEVSFPLHKRTFYSVLKENGYRVGAVGKLDLHKPIQWWGLGGWIEDLETLGFTDAIDNAGKIDAIHSGKEGPKDPYMSYLYSRNLADIHIKDMIERRGGGTDATPLPEEAYCDNWLTANGMEMLERFPAGQPWFLMVNFTGPHGPWDITERMKAEWADVPMPVPPGWEEKDAERLVGIRQNYAAMLENIDRNIGLLLDMVRKRGELDNTIVIYTSDHGEMLGDRRRFGKCVPYQGSVHIPMVISGPGIRQGVSSDALVELQDLAATIVEYAGAYMPEAADSISLRKLLEEGTKQHRAVQLSALDPDGKHTKCSWRMVSDGSYKLNLADGCEPELFHMASDAAETNNIASGHEHIVKKLRDFANL
jgi:arylsulfatase